jgi:sugar O-acyltransferase (sialic acid O-acetyltransferase NeuD family)
MTEERLVVIGASTPTIIRVVDDINRARSRAIQIVGFLDSGFPGLGNEFYGHRMLGQFDAITAYAPAEVVLINTIAGSMDDRVKTTEHFLALGYRFTNIVHPGVNTGYVKMGTGNLVYEGALIHPFVELGNHCVVSSNSGIAHETIVGDYCFIGPASYVCGKVRIEDRVYVGTGARILPRLTVGRGARIGSGSVVTRSVPDGQLIKGIPGRAA